MSDTLLVVIAVWIVAYAVGVWCLVAVAASLHTIRPENRRLQPLLVWLNLVPVLNLYWWPATVRRTAASIRAEFVSLGLPVPDSWDAGNFPGLLAYALILMTPCGGVTFVLAIVQLAIYAREIDGYRREMVTHHDEDAPDWGDNPE